MRNFTSSKGSLGGTCHNQGRIPNPSDSDSSLELRIYSTEFLTSQTQTQYLQNLQNWSQNKRGSEFVELRIYSTEFILSQTQTQHLQNLQIWPRTKKVQNLQNSQFILHKTKPNFAEFVKKKMVRNFAQLRIHSENQIPQKQTQNLQNCFVCVCVCVVLLASPVPPILLLLLLLLVVVVVGRGASMCNHY